MNSRQKTKLAHAARKLGISIELKKQESQSHTPSTESPRRPEDSNQIPQTFAIHFSWVWKLLSGAGVLLGLLTAINSLRYDVSIDSYASLNPKEPLETRFVLTNEGPDSIHHVQYTCEFPGLRIPGVQPNINVVGADVVQFEESEIAAKGRISLRCENPMEMTFGSLMQISVSYRPSYWVGRKSGGTAFLLKQDVSGNAIWLPIGRAKTTKELMK